MLVTAIRSVTLTLLIATLATPAVAQSPQRHTHLGGKASALVTLRTDVAPSASGLFEQVAGDGTLQGPFVLPPGMVLIVTDLDVAMKSPTGTGQVRGFLSNIGPGNIRMVYDFDFPTEARQHVGLTSGTVFSTEPMVLADPATPGTVIVQLFGYLAKAN